MSDISLDCGDSSCYFATKKGGMRTNGGCYCFSSAGFSKSLTSAAREMLPEVLKLRADVERLNAENAKLRECVRLTYKYIEREHIRAYEENGHLVNDGDE